MLIAWIAALPLAAAVTLPPPPSSEPRAPTETRFGITLEDPDRWLEDLKNPAAQEWIKAQADRTRRILDAIPARAEVLADVERLERATPSRIYDLILMRGDRMLLQRQVAGAENPSLFLRAGWDGGETLVLDPDTFRQKTGKPHAINYVVPSPDGSRAVVGVSEAGSEEAAAHLIDLASGKTLETPITRVLFGVSWLPDGSGFFYNRQRQLGPGEPVSERQLNSQAYLHRLGADAEHDPVVFGNRYDKQLGIDAAQLPDVSASVEHEFLIGVPYSVDNRVTIFVAPRADLAKERIGWRRLVGPEDEIRQFVVHGEHLYLLSSKQPNRSVERVAMTPGAAREVVVPAGLLPIDSLAASQDALYYVAKNESGVGSQLYRMPWSERVARPVDLGTLQTPIVYSVQAGASGVAVGGAGARRFFDLVRIDADGVVHPTTLQAQPEGVDAGKLESSVVQVPSHDGTLVPLSLVHRRGLVRDGSNPTLLLAYGAYGFSTEPFLVPAHFAHFDRGFVRAFCHVRGGGERGEAWYRAGFQATKSNTWKDLIACAEYLVKEKYTSPRRLAAQGGSAGGIMIGNAMIERPDLFGVMIPAVGVMDSVGAALRDPNGPVNWPEFGDPNTEAGFKSLVGMSAYHKVRDGTAFPAVMLPHGYNDPRVAVWHSAKMTARLQRASRSDNPVLLNVDYDAGHGVGSAQSSINAQRADLISFMLWQFGVEGYEPQLSGP
jgi:prolyl oligopeptidase